MEVVKLYSDDHVLAEVYFHDHVQKYTLNIMFRSILWRSYSEVYSDDHVLKYTQTIMF